MIVIIIIFYYYCYHHYYHNSICYLQLSAVICNYLRLSAVICSYLRLSAVICSYLQLSAVICSYLRFSAVICGFGVRRQCSHGGGADACSASEGVCIYIHPENNINSNDDQKKEVAHLTWTGTD